MDEHNAFAWNNLSALYFRRGEYCQALDYAEQAIEIDPKMPQPLATAAICTTAALGHLTPLARSAKIFLPLLAGVLSLVTVFSFGDVELTFLLPVKKEQLGDMD